MFHRVGAIAFTLLLALAATAAPTSAGVGVDTECAQASLGTHRSPNLVVDIWITNVKWGPGGLSVGDQDTPVPGFPPGQFPNPDASDPGLANLTEWLMNVTVEEVWPPPTAQLDALLQDAVEFARQQLGGLVDSEFPVVQIEVKIPRPHQEHLPEGVRTTIIIDFRACLPQ